jgi:hypothetical protein
MSIKDDSLHRPLSLSPVHSTTTFYFQQPSAAECQGLELATHYVTQDTRLKRRMYCRQHFPLLAPFLAEVLFFELALTSLTTGSIEAYLQTRVLQPLSHLVEIAGQLVDGDVDSARGKSGQDETVQTGAGPSAGQSKETGGGKAAGGWGSSLSYFLGGSSKKPPPAVPSSTSTSTRPATSPTGRTMSSEEEVGDITVKPLYAYRFGQIKKNFTTLVAQTFAGGSNAATVSAVKIAEEEERLAAVEGLEATLALTRVLRGAAVLLLETLREKNTARKDVLLFLFHHKNTFFGSLPVNPISLGAPVVTVSVRGQTTAQPVTQSATLTHLQEVESKTKEDREYAASLSFYFYQCLYDDDVELRLRALLCWGQLLCAPKDRRNGASKERGGDLTGPARDLLVLQVRSDYCYVLLYIVVFVLLRGGVLVCVCMVP